MTGTSGWVRDDAVAELEAVHLAHVDVGDDGVVLGIGERGQRLGAGRPPGDVEAEGRETLGEHLAHALHVVDDEDAGAWGRIAHAARWGGAFAADAAGSHITKRLPYPSSLSTVDPAAVIAHDAVGDRETEAGALAGPLGGEEGLEEARQVLGGDPGSVVGDREGDEVALATVLTRGMDVALAGRDLDASALGHRLHGVHDQVHERLLDLVLVGRDQEGIVAELGRDRDPPRTRDDRQRVDGAGDDRARAREPEARGAMAGEVEELTDHRGHLVGLLDDDAGAGRRPLAARLAAGDHLGAPGNHGERRPELVRDAGRELADRGQPVGVTEVLERGHARLGLGGERLARVAESASHPVDLAREVADLVVLVDGERGIEVAGRDRP